jgi:hypothetical protein
MLSVSLPRQVSEVMLDHSSYVMSCSVTWEMLLDIPMCAYADPLLEVRTVMGVWEDMIYVLSS